MGSIVSKLFLDFWIFFIFTRSLKTKLNHKRECGIGPFYRSHPLTGLVETFSVGLVETCFNYPLATLHAIIHIGIDRNHTLTCKCSI